MKTYMPVIKNSLFTLRDITVQDSFDLYRFGSDFETTKYLTWGPLESVKEARLLIEKFNLPRVYEGLPVGYAIILNKTDEMIGIIEYHTYNRKDNSAELGFILNKEYQHKGIMTKALKIMIDLGFNHLELNKIVAAHVDLNHSSEKLLKKFNFKYEYKEDFSFKMKDTLELRDIIYLSLYKDEYLKGGC